MLKEYHGLALEPSMFATNLICFMPFALGAFLQMKGKLKEKKNIITIAVLIAATVCAILTTSSTTYVRISFSLWSIWFIYFIWVY